MTRDYSTTWVVSRSMKPLGMFDSERAARDWIAEQGYQDEDQGAPGYVRVDVEFGQAIG